MRGRGGFIGTNVTPASAAINSAASGFWNVREAESLKRAGTWPRALPGVPTVSGLQLHLDAADDQTVFNATTGGSLVAADSGAARWEDKSGNGRHATQDDVNRRPRKRTAFQNGWSALTFDGSSDMAASDFMQINNSTSTFNFLHLAQGTVFVAAINGTTQDYNDIRTWIDNCGLGAGRGFYFGPDDRSSRGNNQACFGSGNQSTNTAVSTPDNFVVMQSAKVYSAVVDNTAPASSRVFIYKNGVDSGARNSASGSTSGDATYSMTIGGNGEALGNLAFQGDMLEILIYNSALSDTDRARIENYLIAKWGIT